jgi:cell division protein FtsI (penicillin-binding protein 3)
MPAAVARQVRDMLEQAVGPDGTAPDARITGFRVAGKTGTVHKSVAGGYSDKQYLSVFAGMAPASDPRLVMVVMVDEPSGSKYYGGQVAAPVFSRVIAGALRLLAVTPDDVPLLQTRKPAGEEPA